MLELNLETDTGEVMDEEYWLLELEEGVGCYDPEPSDATDEELDRMGL